jgi:hypothetical protein
LVSMDQIKVQGKHVVSKPPGSIKGEKFLWFWFKTDLDAIFYSENQQAIITKLSLHFENILSLHEYIFLTVLVS